MNKPITDDQYQKIQTLIMDTLQGSISPGEKTEFNDAAEKFVGMIEFLEAMYISTILSMVGSFVATLQDTDDEDFKAHLMTIIRETMKKAGGQVQKTLDKKYEIMIADFGFADPLAEKSHNENVADAIRRELGKNRDG